MVTVRVTVMDMVMVTVTGTVMVSVRVLGESGQD
jgi:hypothetical protein